MYQTLDAQAAKSPSLNKTMFMGSGTAKAPEAPKAGPDTQKAAGLAKTMMAPAPRLEAKAKPVEAKPVEAKPVEAKAQKRTPTLPSLGSTEILPAPVVAPPPVPPELLTPAPDLKPAIKEMRPVIPAAMPLEAQATDADISIEIDTPPPAPPSQSGLPAWAVNDPMDDAGTGPLLSPTATLLRARSTKIGAAALGLVGLVVTVVLLTRGGKPTRSVAVEAKTPPAAPEKAAPAPTPEPTPPPVVAEPVPPTPPPRAAKAPPKAPPAVVAKAPPAAPKAPPPEMAARKPAEPSRPRPVAAAIPAAEKPAPERKVMVASAKHVAAATPSGEPARRPGIPSEDDQRLAREAYARGNSQLFQGHVDEAITAFKESLKLDGRNPASQRGLGLAYMQAGNSAQAVVFLKRYLKASPTASDRAMIEKRLEQLSGR
jgi:hypothetical protein